MAVGPAITVTGIAISMYGNHKKAKAEEAATRARAAAKRLQASKLLERFERNSKILLRSGKQFQGKQAAQFIKGGVDIGTGSPLLAFEETYRSTLEQLDIERTEANDKAELLRAGADLDTKLAGDIRSAAKTQNAAIFLQGAGKVVQDANK